MAWNAALDTLHLLADILLRPIAGQLVGLPDNAAVRHSFAASKSTCPS